MQAYFVALQQKVLALPREDPILHFMLQRSKEVRKARHGFPDSTTLSGEPR
jgi:hypothetical protein